MSRKHIAFILSPAHGHIIPTLGIASRLVQRGFRVTYAVEESFANRVAATGAQACVYEPLDYRVEFLPLVERCREKAYEIWTDFVRRETATAQAQLSTLYYRDEPDLVVYDLRTRAGSLLASQWDVRKIEHSPLPIESDGAQDLFGQPYDDDLVLVSLPSFIQENIDRLNGRFRFTGFCASERAGFFEPWTSKPPSEKAILVSGTTSGATQEAFFKPAIEALRELNHEVILSIGQTDPASLGSLPPGFSLNRNSSNVEILPHCRLFVGQGGQGSTLEALYFGVPVLLIPPGGIYEKLSRRTAALGLGYWIPSSVASPSHIRTQASALLEDAATQARVADARVLMHADDGAQRGADLIEEYVTTPRPSADSQSQEPR